MSYGAPWEQGVSAADTVPLRAMEVPGLVPVVDGVKINIKKARRNCYQRGRRQRRREEKSSRKAQAREGRDCRLDVIAEVVEANRQEIRAVSRGLDLCEAMVCNDIASVRMWVMGALEMQQDITLCMMNEMVKVATIIKGSGRMQRVEEKVAEEIGAVSGGHSVQEADASEVEGDGMGNASGKPASPAGAPSMQAGACGGSCGSAAGAVGGTSDQSRLSAAPDVHVREGCSAAPVVAAAKKMRRRAAAAAKTLDGGDRSVTTDGGITDSAVLLESWADVDARDESGDDMRVGAAGGAESVVGRMQVVEEAIDSAADLRGGTAAGVLPTDGRVQRQLEKELEYARLEYARHYKNKGRADSQLFHVMVAA